ncbi:hypothetical protein BKA81DRAFT_157146 [Phyllosticta paracitricarpa]
MHAANQRRAFFYHHMDRQTSQWVGEVERVARASNTWLQSSRRSWVTKFHSLNLINLNHRRPMRDGMSVPLRRHPSSILRHRMPPANATQAAHPNSTSHTYSKTHPSPSVACLLACLLAWSLLGRGTIYSISLAFRNYWCSFAVHPVRACKLCARQTGRPTPKSGQSNEKPFAPLSVCPASIIHHQTYYAHHKNTPTHRLTD